MASYKAAIAVLLCLTLFPTSFFLLIADYQWRVDIYSKEVKRGAPYGMTPQIFRYPPPSSLFAKGIDARIMEQKQVAGVFLERAPDRSQQNPLYGLFVTPDFMYLIQFVMSLVAILFAFDAISMEKESGTLRLTLSNAVSRSQMLLGKWMGGHLSILVPFTLVVLLGLLQINFSPAVSLNVQDWQRIGLIILISFIYVSLFFNVGLLVSALCHRASISLIVSLFLWAIWTLVVPNLAVLTAKQVHPIPSAEEIQAGKNAARNDVMKGVGWITSAMWDEAIRRMDKIDDDYRRQLQRQQAITTNLTRLSPAASYTYACTAIAGTGVEDEQNYLSAILRYVDETRRFIYREIKERPDFIHGFRRLSDAFSTAIWDTGLLLCLSIALFVGSYAAFLKYDVR